MRRFMNFIAGVFLGALVGSVTAILLAPASGDELRERIRQQTMSFRDEVKDAYQARVTQLETELENLRAPKPKSTG
jgi:gas vesicle protein